MLRFGIWNDAGTEALALATETIDEDLWFRAVALVLPEKGYHVVVRPRGNPVVGQRNALKMAIWPNLVDATAYCINLAEMYYD